MYSTFSHGNDSQIRIGDPVATRDTLSIQQWQSSNNVFGATGGAGKHEPPRKYRKVQPRTDCHLKRSNTPGGGINSSSSSSAALLAKKKRGSDAALMGVVPASVHSGLNMNASPTAQLFDVDVSSVTSTWKSMTRGTWLCEEERHTDLIGIVEQVKLSDQVALVKVWARGDVVDTTSKRKQVEEVPLHLLQKLTQQEFQLKCKTKFMHDVSHQLQLRGEGYDESAPLALIAYNNRIISNLIDRIDTSADLTKLKSLKITKPPKGIGAIRNMPIPTIIPVEDPLADVRDELRALAAGGTTDKKKTNSKKSNSSGGMSSNNKKGDGRGGGDNANSSSVNPNEEEELKDVRCVASRQSTRGGGTPSVAYSSQYKDMPLELGVTTASLGVTSTLASGTGQLSPGLGLSTYSGGGHSAMPTTNYTSLSEDVISSAAEKARVELASRLGKVKDLSVQGTLGVTGMSGGGQCTTPSPLGGSPFNSRRPTATSESGAFSDTLGSSRSSSLLPSEPELAHNCSLLDVSADGKLLFRPRAGGQLFIAYLAHLQLFVSQDLTSITVDKRGAGVSPTMSNISRGGGGGGESEPEEEDNPLHATRFTDAIHYLRQYKQCMFDVRAVERHPSGASLVIATNETGDTLQEELLMKGMASVVSEAKDSQMVSLGGGGRGAKSRRSSSWGGGPRRSIGSMGLIDRLYKSQEVAKGQRRGLWESSSVAQLFEDGEVTVQHTMISPTKPTNGSGANATSPRKAKPSASQNTPSPSTAALNVGTGTNGEVYDADVSEYMAPLFTTFESSSRFRRKLQTAMEEAHDSGAE